MDLFEDEDGFDMGAIFDEGGSSAADGYGGGRPLATGAPSSPRRQGYAGLLNQGNTCYLNSLVQGLYATPEVRRSLYSLTEKDLVVEMDAAEVAAAEVTAAQPARVAPVTQPAPVAVAPAAAAGPPALSAADHEALEMLCGMGFDASQVRRAIARFPVDPDNMQRVEFILSGAAEVAEAAAVTVASSAASSKANETSSTDDGEDGAVSDLFGSSNGVGASPAPVAPVAAGPAARALKERRIPKELQTLFARMQSADANAQSTKKLTECFGAGFSVAIQHDVHELNRILFDRLEKQLRGTAIHDLINQLYRGTMVNRIVCKSCGYRSERLEDFLDVSLVVRDFASVEASLWNFVEDELLAGNNLYECGGCKSKVEALKGVRFRALPPVLILSLSRFEFDARTFERVKNSRRFPFPRVLDMSPFMETPADEPHAVAPAQAPYDLFGVVIHRGDQASHGHYHAYLLDVLNESGLVGQPRSAVLGETKSDGKADDGGEGPFEGWFDFNDSHVRPISSATVDTQFGGNTGSSECAYMLFYRQRGSPALMQRGDAPPRLPAQLEATIEAENAVGIARRVEWEQLKNSIELNLFTPASLEMVKGHPCRRPKVVVDDDDDDDDADDDNDGNSSGPRRARASTTCTIDRRKTLGDLKALITTLFEPDALPLAPRPMQLHRIRFMDQQRVKFLRPLNRPLSSTGMELLLDDTAKLDELSTVTHGCDILVWDGEHLCDQGEPYEVAYDLITLCVTLFEDDGTARMFETQAREGSTLRQLRELLHAPRDAWWLFRWDYMRLTELEGEDRSMQELYLNDHVKMSMERRRVPEGGGEQKVETTHTARFLRESEEKMDVYVLNRCDATEVKEGVSCNLTMTVWDLKQAIVKRIGTLNERLPMRLRRTLVGGGEGELLPDDGATLRRAGIQPHMLIIIEYGEPPDASNVTVKYTWGTAGGMRLLDQMQSVCVEITVPLRELKRRIVTALHLENDVSTYRLRKSDFWSHQREIFEDEEKTLKQLGVKDSDCVWIEEGAIPPKGTVELQVELQTSLWETGARDEASAPAASLQQRNAAADLWDTMAVGHLHVARTATLADLRQLVSTDSVLGSLVAGRVFRLWHKGRLLRGAATRTLKKLGVTVSSTLTLQVLGEGVAEHAQLAGDDENAVLLVVRQRIFETRSFARPVELVVAAQRRGQQHFVRRADLLDGLCALAGLPVTEPLLVLRLIAQSGRWKALVDPLEREEGEAVEMVDMSAAKGVKALHAAQVERKRADELFVSDGDLLVWKVVASDPANDDPLLAQLNHTFGERVYVSSSSAWPSDNGSGGAGGGPRKAYARPKEVSLQIEDDEYWGN